MPVSSDPTTSFDPAYCHLEDIVLVMDIDKAIVNWKYSHLTGVEDEIIKLLPTYDIFLKTSATFNNQTNYIKFHYGSHTPTNPARNFEIGMWKLKHSLKNKTATRQILICRTKAKDGVLLRLKTVSISDSVDLYNWKANKIRVICSVKVRVVSKGCIVNPDSDKVKMKIDLVIMEITGKRKTLHPLTAELIDGKLMWKGSPVLAINAIQVASDVIHGIGEIK
jgi:hypothetical protein